MKNYRLNINEIENKIVITIEKDELDSDYILNLVNWLQYAVNQTGDYNSYLQLLPKTKPESSNSLPKEKRVWNFAGSVNLNNGIDNINLRDLAYD